MTSATRLCEVNDAEEEHIVATPSAAPKCERCWHYVESVGHHAEHAGLCARCVDNLFGGGETRTHA